MYHLGINKHTQDTNMYVYSTNLHLLRVKKIQRCTFGQGTAPMTAFVPFFLKKRGMYLGLFYE